MAYNELNLMNYQRKLKEHTNRMKTRIPKQILHYLLRGQRSTGQPMKRWEENETITGHLA